MRETIAQKKERVVFGNTDAECCGTCHHLKSPYCGELHNRCSKHDMRITRKERACKCDYWIIT